MLIVETATDVAKRIAGTKKDAVLKELSKQPDQSISIHKLGAICSNATLRTMRDELLIEMETGGPFGGGHAGVVRLAPRGKSVCISLLYL